MILGRLQRSSRGWIPESDSVVLGCRRDQLTVRREGDSPDRIRMTLERLQ